MSHLIDQADAILPTSYGRFKIYVFKNDLNDKEDVALVYDGPDRDPSQDWLVRVHSECMTGDVFGSLKCDCGPQLHQALQLIAAHKNGALLYLRQEGRGIGLFNKIKAYHFQDGGQDTVQANHSVGFVTDLRNYCLGAEILQVLGIDNIILLTNNPEKISQLEHYGIHIKAHQELLVGVNDYNRDYLATKRDQMGHLIQKDLNDVK